jgi:hypothetical protein
MNVNWKALLKGYVAYICANLLFGVLAAVLLVVRSDGEVEPEMAFSYQGDPFFRVFTLSTGLLAALCAGFVAARCAKQHPRMHAIGMGGVLLLISLLLLAVGWESPHGLRLILTVPAAWAGSLVSRN